MSFITSTKVKQQQMTVFQSGGQTWETLSNFFACGGLLKFSIAYTLDFSIVDCPHQQLVHKDLP